MKSLIALACVAVLLTACGGGGETKPTTTSASTTGTATVAATGSPATATSGTPIPSGNERIDDEDKVEAAMREIFDAQRLSPCPANTRCANPTNTLETLLGGISVWSISEASGEGFVGVLGRTTDDEWKFWFAAQQAYPLITLPGEVRVCANGDGLRLRSLPSTTAPPVASLDDNAINTVDQFVLTEPGTYAPGASTNGYGWYHTQTEPEGWAYSKYLSTAALSDCALRDALETP